MGDVPRGLLCTSLRGERTSLPSVIALLIIARSRVFAIRTEDFAVTSRDTVTHIRWSRRKEPISFPREGDSPVDLFRCPLRIIHVSGTFICTVRVRVRDNKYILVLLKDTASAFD